MFYLFFFEFESDWYSIFMILMLSELDSIGWVWCWCIWVGCWCILFGWVWVWCYLSWILLDRFFFLMLSELDSNSIGLIFFLFFSSKLDCNIAIANMKLLSFKLDLLKSKLDLFWVFYQHFWVLSWIFLSFAFVWNVTLLTLRLQTKARFFWKLRLQCRNSNICNPCATNIPASI